MFSDPFFCLVLSKFLENDLDFFRINPREQLDCLKPQIRIKIVQHRFGKIILVRVAKFFQNSERSISIVRITTAYLSSIRTLRTEKAL